MFSAKDIACISSARITNNNLYNPLSRDPHADGVLDQRLGTSTRSGLCGTCGLDRVSCVGHWGHIPLALPVFHPGFIKHIVGILQSVCKHCSHVLLDDAHLNIFIARMDRALTINDRTTRTLIQRALRKECAKQYRCLHCNRTNGPVRKLPKQFAFVHHEFKSKEGADTLAEFCYDFENAIEFNPELEQHLESPSIDLTPLVVLEIFKKIRADDLPLLDFPLGRPEDMIITILPVPPVCLRPSVPMGYEGSNEDDLSCKLSEILNINRILTSSFETGSVMTSKLFEHWSNLQIDIAQYFNSDVPGFPRSVLAKRKPIRAFTQRLKGKQGRFRGNLSGKRVDFSSRTVISPDPNLCIDEIGVPIILAKILTIAERVNRYNIDQLRATVIQGPNEINGANYIIKPNGYKIYLKYVDRVKMSTELAFGWIVERHLRNDDVVLFNRQPSLHRQSIMAHRVRLHSWRTFRFNTCVCAPYNADFDGDEMNVHVPQTVEARAEARILMSVPNNIVTPKNGEPLVVPAQDLVSAVFLLSQRDCFFSKSEFVDFCVFLSDGLFDFCLPPPTIIKPMCLWTGKQIFTLMIQSNNNEPFSPINLSLRARNYSGEFERCSSDGYVVIRDSELLLGNICKATIGSSKKGLFHVLLHDANNDIASQIMNRLSKLCSRFLTNRGFSIGIDDVEVSPSLSSLKARLLNEGYNSCSSMIQSYEKQELDAVPGFNIEETLESMLLGRLSQIREDAGASCLKELPSQFNSPLIMALCGSKGSKINISQMIACVGQQAVSGKRIQNGFGDRSLPHFSHAARDPQARGFVQNSFYSGLNATEFFFHTMGGREGLVDTAVKTAETGYMQRRLMKTLEDLVMLYDGTVRNSEDAIIQFLYGEDSLNPSSMEEDGPVDFERAFTTLRSLDDGVPITPRQFVTLFEAALSRINADNFEFDVKPLDSFNSHVNINGVLNNVNLVFATKLRSAIQAYARTFIGNLLHFGVKYNQHEDYEYSRQQLSLLVLSQSLVTSNQVEDCILRIAEKYRHAEMLPGEGVGAVAAQSIGEPGTQMTLKTFHFAGVASMNVTLGVPRIKEIINASKDISTPVINISLSNSSDVKIARIVKGRIERTMLGQIALSIKQVISPTQGYIVIVLDLDVISQLQLDVNVKSVCDAILDDNKRLKLKLKLDSITIISSSTLTIAPQDLSKDSFLFSLLHLQNSLPLVVVAGIRDISRAMIHKNNNDRYSIRAEGSSLLSVIGSQGVDGSFTTSNNIMTIASVLGVEAARATIISEITTTMQSHGLTVDPRHAMLLADVMSYRGEILGITRFGLVKMKQSILMLASFEQTVDHLYDAASRGIFDPVKGISECIITGAPIPLGTGLFRLLAKV